ncbi:MAG TPA: 6-phosphogluconolactonase [Gemmatimonadaceae bacterium]|nr:6-phosphogluconolactonase [Gemmatimonadaceae bacterium]
MHPEIVVGTPPELAQRFLAELAHDISSLRAGSRLTLAVPGGSVGDSIFPTLANAPFEWKDVDIFWTDERAVPPSSPDSNFAQADRLWLTPARVPQSCIHRMPADDGDLARATASYARTMQDLAGIPPTLDRVLLGVGADGHVASVFPGDPSIQSSDFVTWTARAPKAPRTRMSLSLKSLARGRHIVIAAFDVAKAFVIASAVRDPADSTPLALLLRTSDRPRLFLTADVVDAMGTPNVRAPTLHGRRNT